MLMTATDHGPYPYAGIPWFSAAFGRILRDRELDGSLKALALTLPGEKLIGQAMDVIDPDCRTVEL